MWEVVPPVELEHALVGALKGPRGLCLEKYARACSKEVLVELALVVGALPPGAIERGERLAHALHVEDAVACGFGGVGRGGGGGVLGGVGAPAHVTDCTSAQQALLARGEVHFGLRLLCLLDLVVLQVRAEVCTERAHWDRSAVWGGAGVLKYGSLSGTGNLKIFY